ncbi:MAG: histidine ammonia-lyase [Bacteroidia bacterium]
MQEEKVRLSAQQRAVVEESFQFLTEFSKDKIIYGINTGFGPMAQYRIENEELEQLQYNLVRSHASGLGGGLPDQYVRAVMLNRLNTLALGGSGISIGVVDQLVLFLDNGIYPYIPEHGSVGASGDLVQLAHLALGLIGEGEARYKGKTRLVKDILKELKIEPVKLQLRDGLGLMNGTSCMSGIGLLNVIYATRLLRWATLIGAVINEIVRSYDDSYSEFLNRAKKHKGQQRVAAAMRRCLETSKLVRKREDRLFKDIEKVGNGKPIKEKVQEYYSFRCIPQIIGPILETVQNAEEILLDEVNSTNDNPVVDLENKHVYHGGNFHGDYVALEMDKMKIAVTKLSMLCERQLNYLMNDKLNDIFPPFMNLGKLGYNFGVQGMQFTATSTTAENQTLAFPMYVHSIPNNNDNQDIVSMGTNAALLAKKVIDNSFQVMSIEAVAIAQGVDSLGCRSKMSVAGQNFYDTVRKHLATFEDDKPRSKQLADLAEFLHENDPQIEIF